MLYKIDNMSRFTIHEFNRLYPDDEACFMEISRRKLGEAFACPVCGLTMYRRYKRKFWQCKHDHRISPLVGTIFEGSHLGLKNWFYAMYQISITKQGYSANKLAGELGISYTAAHRMMHKIRSLMSDETPLSGTVEIDEAYIGGVRKGFKGRAATGRKHAVMGMVERGGWVKTVVVENDRAENLIPQVRKYVKKGSWVYTDQLPAYVVLPKLGYNHFSVNHSRELVTGDGTNTNTIEGFWSGMKNGIRGVYKHASERYIQNYADEYAWRYSNRNNSVPTFKLLLDLAT